MPFRDIACYVWATDGWTNDVRTTEVVNRFTACGNQFIDLATGNSTDWELILRNKIKRVVEACRGTDAPLTDFPCTIGGVFTNRVDSTPTHMYIIYENHIYDTIPNVELIKKPATNQFHPGCEANRAGTFKVGRYKSVLTTSQWHVINTANTATAWSDLTDEWAGTQGFDPR